MSDSSGEFVHERGGSVLDAEKVKSRVAELSVFVTELESVRFTVDVLECDTKSVDDLLLLCPIVHRVTD